MLYIMTTNITFLVIGQILLSIGLLGDFTNNPYLAFICVAFALFFFTPRWQTLLEDDRLEEHSSEVSLIDGRRRVLWPVALAGPHQLITTSWNR